LKQSVPQLEPIVYNVQAKLKENNTTETITYKCLSNQITLNMLNISSIKEIVAIPKNK
jgi:membrane-bound inhibitor of C-type lysozyme